MHLVFPADVEVGDDVICISNILIFSILRAFQKHNTYSHFLSLLYTRQYRQNAASENAISKLQDIYIYMYMHLPNTRIRQ